MIYLDIILAPPSKSLISRKLCFSPITNNNDYRNNHKCWKNEIVLVVQYKHTIKPNETLLPNG